MPEGSLRRSAERLKFFTDAVVAIAMTLLILPLLEDVSEAARQGADTATYFSEHSDQLLSFVLSFVIIAGFWVSHERLFDEIVLWTGWLLVLNIVWMFTIVFLPVATALAGSMDFDALQAVVYIGTMLVSSVAMTAMQVVVRRNPSTWSRPEGPLPGGLAASASQVVLFTVALVVAVLVPAVGYLALLVLLLTGPMQRVLRRRMA